MEREGFVLGTYHLLQQASNKCKAASISLLETEVKRILTEHNIRWIAEEMSVDGLEKNAQQEPCQTVCQRIAGDDMVEFVDLDMQERAKLSLSTLQIHDMSKHPSDIVERRRIKHVLDDLCGDVRERVWVARVLKRNEWPVLFVCGASHAVSVDRLFRSVGVQSKIIHRDFDPDEYPWMKANED